MPIRAMTLREKYKRTPQPDNRLSAAARGYGPRWKKARRFYLTTHPLCVICSNKGIVRVGNVVDHKIPHKGNMTLFWDQSNWQTLCTPHHNIKTATEDGGFGHKIKGDNHG